MKYFIHLLLVIVITFVGQASFAQSNKKFKGKKRTSKREIRKRQQEAFEKDDENAFNPIQPMGARENTNRDDLLWHFESANTVYHGAGNISLTTPSRYGLKPGLEVSSLLVADYWVPNLFIKKRWNDKKWIVATKHGFYSATLGLRWADKNGYDDIVHPAFEVPYIAPKRNRIPFILSMNNELMVSRAIYGDLNCGRGTQPIWIFTGGIGADFGVDFGTSDLQELQGHFFANRSPALIGSGYSAYVKLRADWQMAPSASLGAQVKYFRGDFSGDGSLEHNAALKLFLYPKISLSAGYYLSVANYIDEKKVGILPFIDISYYFGRKQGRQKGLFKGRMF